jgi:diguanylate cyclase (GGDEF)-like protein
MSIDKEHEIAEAISSLVLDVLMLARPPQDLGRFASVDSLQSLHGMLVSLRDFLSAASSGDLSKPIPFKGYVGGSLKTLQANLKHLSWQTKMVASGDFSQRVEFMGEFAESFNAMVRQLDQTLQELSRVNEDLVKEIAIRKETEDALRESERALRFQAATDSLTGLYNRRHFNELAEVEIRKAIRYSRSLSVVMLDVDFFKKVNDNFGHASGDLVLQLVAKTAKNMLRGGDVLGRYGGEEFICLLPETPAVQAALVADRLRKKIENSSVQAENNRIRVTASFGVSDCFDKSQERDIGRTLSNFIDSADRALYLSKNAGRNRVTVFDPEQEPLLCAP